ncbi:MAG TPA: hypothetical protein VGW80_09125 [Solirubrobacterales bacterium]|jgi:hypothetical protein|nr:hypothetical protein [Solirubrobacterales bacterium]
MEWTLRKAPSLLLAAALVAAAVLLLALTWHFTFLLDSWEFLMNRRGFDADAFLKPHNEHIVVIPVAIQQLFLHLFGMDTARPEYVLLTIGLLVTDYLLFVYLRRRVGPWLALFGALLILFLGPAWELLLWPFEISLLGSVLFGLAMLLALERDDRSGDILACLALAISLGFSSLGIPFAVAALVAILQSPRERWRRRAFVFVIPVLLYALWYLGWGHEAESHLSLRNVLASPRFVAESLAAGVGNLFGLGTSPVSGTTELFWGAALVVAIVAALGYRQWQRPSFDPGLWPVAAAAAVNWFLTAFNQIPGRDPASSRYQYASCVFIVMLLANLLARERFSRRALLVGVAVTVLAVAPNLVVLKDGRDSFEAQSVLTRADTAAIEIARRSVPAEFELTPEVAGTPGLIDIFAGRYLEAVDDYGSPAYSEAELLAAPPQFRRQADIVLSQALPLRTAVTPNGYDGAGGRENCLPVPGGAPPDSEVALHPGPTRIEVAPGAEAHFTLRRFAEGEYPVPTAGAPGGSTVVLRVPRDESPRPWYLHAEAAQSIRVCR